MLAALCLVAIEAAADYSRLEQPVRRQGMFMGMDPGVALRVEPLGQPVYARLDIRLGGCITDRFHLGVDWRGDQIVNQVDGVPEKRHEIGPVATFFMIEGWFARIFVHLAGIEPVVFTGGGQTGYEWSFNRYGAIGFALGADTDVPVDGQPPIAYSFSLSVYLTAYDLGSRRGREFDSY